MNTSSTSCSLAVKLPALLQVSCHLSCFSGMKYMDPSTSYDSNGFQPRQPLPVTEWLFKLRTDLTEMRALAINHQEESSQNQGLV